MPRRVLRRARSLLKRVVPAPKSPYATLLNEHGVLASSRTWSAQQKLGAALYFAYRERAEVALHVAYMYPGGDYFEFGSDGMGTFRNFLTAYDVNALDQRFPDTRFYAFDIFGVVAGEDGAPGGMSAVDERYFRDYEHPDKYRQALDFVRNHGLFTERCFVIQGYFQSSLSDEFRRELVRERRRIGFAFLDCNITSSYELCLDFVHDFLDVGSFVYLDEYFTNKEVPALFDRFGAKLRERGLQPRFIRNAGAFGGLFQLFPA